VAVVDDGLAVVAVPAVQLDAAAPTQKDLGQNFKITFACISPTGSGENFTN
jgi:hypothetical protein